jgi:hypothetical protein
MKNERTADLNGKIDMVNLSSIFKNLDII